MKNLIDTIKSVKVPEALDLTTDEIEAIRTEADAKPFDLISLAFQCGFMRGQSVAQTSWDGFEPMVQTMERLHSLVIAMAEALAGADEANRQAIEFAPGMRFIDMEMHGLLTSMEIALQEHKPD